jgi:transcriptional regulator with XRE-family HTH domain
MASIVNTLSIDNMATLLLMETWQQRLRAHMREEGITQAEIANRLDLTQGAIGHWLRGRNEITLKDFARLCRAAGANAQYIMFGTAPTGPEIIDQIRKLVSAPAQHAVHEPSRGSYNSPKLAKNQVKKARKPRKTVTSSHRPH